MPENLNPNETTNYDDELARFADRVIGGEQPEVPEMDGKDQELAQLMSTVVSLGRAMSADQPDPVMTRRIRANLLAEWERSGPAAEQGSFWERLRLGRKGWSSAQQRQVTSLVMAIGMVTLAIFAYALLGPGGITGSLTGSTGGMEPVNTALIVGGLVVLAGVIWWLSRPHR